MLSLYLSTGPDIPAGGLYHYQPTGTDYDESLVRADGQPGPPIRRLLNLQLPAAPEPWQPNYFVDVSDWLEIVDGPETSYLASMTRRYGLICFTVVIVASKFLHEVMRLSAAISASSPS
jgi:hypothetical protein